MGSGPSEEDMVVIALPFLSQTGSWPGNDDIALSFARGAVHRRESGQNVPVGALETFFRVPRLADTLAQKQDIHTKNREADDPRPALHSSHADTGQPLAHGRGARQGVLFVWHLVG